MKSVDAILKKDQALNDEVMDLLSSGKNLPTARRYGVGYKTMARSMIGPSSESPLPEAMIKMHLRPALLVRNNKIDPPDSVELRKRLVPLFPKLECRIPSVGRIEIHNVGQPFTGTGWMVSDNVLVTNRHVAQTLAARKGQDHHLPEERGGRHVCAPLSTSRRSTSTRTWRGPSSRWRSRRSSS